jgi:hypothetical protein
MPIRPRSTPTSIVLCGLFLAIVAGTCRGEPSVQVLMSAETKQAPTAKRVLELAHEVAAELGLHGEQLPNMLLIYAKPGSATIHNLPENTGQFLQKVETRNGTMYEIWIMGTTAEPVTIFGLAAALNQQFELGLDTEQLKQVIVRVDRKRKTTIPVEALRSGR